MAKHYIRQDGIFITKAFSTDFEQPIEGDICVNEDGGRHFNLDLMDERGLPIKKYVDGEILPATPDDLADKIAEYEASLPDPSTTIEARVLTVEENQELTEQAVQEILELM